LNNIQGMSLNNIQGMSLNNIQGMSLNNIQGMSLNNIQGMSLTAYSLHQKRFKETLKDISGTGLNTEDQYMIAYNIVRNIKKECRLAKVVGHVGMNFLLVFYKLSA